MMVPFWGHNREAGVKPARTRRCVRGRNPRKTTGRHKPGREGAGSRVIRQSEDLPSCLRFVEKVNPQANTLGGFFCAAK